METLKAGELDPEFGHEGIQSLEPHGEFFRALGLSRSGKGFLVSGSNQGSELNDSNFILMKLDHQGNRDRSFATDGVVEARFSSDASLSSIGLKALTLEDSKIILIGQFNNGTNAPLPGLARFLASGQFDTAFAEQGTHVVRTSLIPESGAPSEVVIDGCRQSDGALVTINPHVAGPELTMTLIVKTYADGTPDDEFNGGQGYVDAQQRGGEETRLNAIAVDKRDAILACGQTTDVRGIKTGNIMRFHANGRKDTSFANNGALQSTELNFNYLQTCDDRTLCSGSTRSGEALIVQLDLDGNPLHAPSITPAELSIRWIKVVWHNNCILALGEQETVFGVGTVVARFNERGILDPSFGRDGPGWTSILFEGQSGEPLDIVLEDDSRILVLALVKDLVGSYTYFLARLLN
ncbi:delta-60 repeat domain-containing protein [Pseudomonas koreensis]|uniref:delta-60 repeat domain-containing protein n=1 Tax=Pseudomonas koreensis TaxID=198620 RepID=UPI0021C9A300|nr:delta-60 repeat domain-containing protein [Pseudomonas koreensis]MCU0073806.1 delta-60 repeat domain-containing protein [Pseudomonas koreensis]